MTAILKEKITLEEYFELDKNAEGRFEYHDGYAFEMSGVSITHADIEANLMTILKNKLASRDCKVNTANVRIKVPKLLTAVRTFSRCQCFRRFSFPIAVSVQNPLDTGSFNGYLIIRLQMKRDVAISQMRPFDGFISRTARRVFFNIFQYPTAQFPNGRFFFFARRPPLVAAYNHLRIYSQPIPALLF